MPTRPIARNPSAIFSKQGCRGLSWGCMFTCSELKEMFMFSVLISMKQTRPNCHLRMLPPPVPEQETRRARGRGCASLEPGQITSVTITRLPTRYTHLLLYLRSHTFGPFLDPVNKTVPGAHAAPLHERLAHDIMTIGGWTKAQDKPLQTEQVSCTLPVPDCFIFPPHFIGLYIQVSSLQEKQTRAEQRRSNYCTVNCVV